MRVGYEITVRGQYFAMGAQGKTVRFYPPQTFMLPEVSRYRQGTKKVKRLVNGKPKMVPVPNIVEANSLRAAKHLILRYHLADKLAEVLDDFASVRTISIVSTKRVNVDANQFRDIDTVPIAEMTASELNQFHAMHDLTVALQSLENLADRRRAVALEYEELKRREAKQSVSREQDELLSEPTVESGVALGEFSDEAIEDEPDPAEELE